MIEQGFAMLLDARLAVSSIAPVPPGAFVKEPKDQLSAANPKAWCFHGLTAVADYALNAQMGWTEWTLQVDCHGYSGDDMIKLARAIEAALRPPFPALLSDPDNTRLFGIFRLPTQVDGESVANRSYVRSLEFTVQYQQI